MSSRLTRREREAAALVGQGHTNRQIGAALSITAGIAGRHIQHILRALGLETRAQLVTWATQQTPVTMPVRQSAPSSCPAQLASAPDPADERAIT